MLKLMNCVLIFIVLVMIFHSTETSCLEAGDEHEYNYVQGSANGPENWGDIHPSWADCKNGTMQSPINLSDQTVEVGAHLNALNRSYSPTNANLTNKGHDVALKWIGGGGTIHINNTEYVLQECHWHSPSEHTFNGQRFALELHMVHEATGNKKAVTGITYTYGEPDTFLTQLMVPLGTLALGDNQEISVGVLNPNDINMGNGKYYRYMGSLTTPPCTENVTWTMVKEVRTASQEQVSLLRAAIGNDSQTNARPLQNLNNRPVYLYEP